MHVITSPCRGLRLIFDLNRDRMLCLLAIAVALPVAGLLVPA